ncbi:hypothetical protein [Pseudobutyrivibrio sp.]|uniref:hypothetical protein n=1 Tax=Pseudobutyrivibrio sp. TaxID=2014367 RepID=UPI0025F88DA2|nr:hypothetical protein [Pseudobutyrivibrio sp.]MBR5649518.1 hypothetical protein [Pseudobutyrivibrio sp.]
MKKRNLFALAVMMGITAGTIGATTIDSEAKTITVAQDASQVTYGTLTAEQKEMIATLFDADYYAYTNYDVVEALGSDYDALFNHFCDCGIWEGRKGWPDFDPSAYASAYPQLKEAYGNNILAYYLDYYNTGIAEGRYLTTVEKCEENGIKVQSLFGEWQFLDVNIYQAASYLSDSNGDSSNGGGGAAVVNTGDGNTAVVVNAEDTETLSLVEKCQGLNYVGTLKVGDDFFVILVAKTEPGYDVYREIDYNNSISEMNPQSSKFVFLDSTYAKDENGNLDPSKVVANYNEDEVIVYFASIDDYEGLTPSSWVNDDDEIVSATGDGLGVAGKGVTIFQENIYSRTDNDIEYKPVESTSTYADIVMKQDSQYYNINGRIAYSQDPQFTEDTEYTVGVSISEDENGVVDFTIGAYNEESGFAESAGFTLQEN